MHRFFMMLIAVGAVAPFVVHGADPRSMSTVPASPSNNNHPSVRGVADAGSTVRLFTNGTCAGSPAATGDTATFVSPGLVVDVADNATITFAVQSVDVQGRVSGCVFVATYTEDSTTPATPTAFTTIPVSPADHNDPLIQGMVEAYATVRLYTNATCSGTLSATGSAEDFSRGLAVHVADNTTTTLYATATDRAGNTSVCSAGVTYTENTAAASTLPQIRSMMPSSGPIGTVVTISGERFQAGTMFTVNDQPIFTPTTLTATSSTITIPRGGDSPRCWPGDTCTIRVFERYGGAGGNTILFTAAPSPGAPTITSVRAIPNSVDATGSGKLLIQGTGFTEDNVLYVGQRLDGNLRGRSSLSAVISRNGGTEIYSYFPRQHGCVEGQPCEIGIRNANGLVKYRIAALPALLTPGPRPANLTFPVRAQVGEQVTITGTGFTPADNEVYLWRSSMERGAPGPALAAYSVLSTDGIHLTVTIPAAMYAFHPQTQGYVRVDTVYGEYSVSVANTNGSSGFALSRLRIGLSPRELNPPTITDIQPQDVRHGQGVTVTGRNLQGSNLVRISGTNVGTVSTMASTTLQFTIPDFGNAQANALYCAPGNTCMVTLRNEEVDSNAFPLRFVPTAGATPTPSPSPSMPNPSPSPTPTPSATPTPTATPSATPTPTPSPSPRKPDLVVRDAVFIDKDLRWTVVNAGTAATTLPLIEVRHVWVNARGRMIGSTQTLQLRGVLLPGRRYAFTTMTRGGASSAKMKKFLATPLKGAVALRMIVDPRNFHQESDETNNSVDTRR